MSSPTSSSPPTTTYDGNCHCGAVRYTVKMAPLESTKVMRCNCSICTKNGYYLVYPLAKDVVFHQGEDHLKSYRFGNQKAEHRFCPTCGSSVLINANHGEKLAMNARLFKGVEVEKFDFTDFDGWSKLQPAYSV